MQPPSGGCVLKLLHYRYHLCLKWQPPSGGCVLKLNFWIFKCSSYRAAAFGRLCVETNLYEDLESRGVQPPSGGCVLKLRG